MEEFKYDRILLTSEGRLKLCSGSSNAVKRKLKLRVKLPIYS